MKLCERFISIQGEGKFGGRYAYFVRLAGCNLSCEGFGCEVRSPKTGEILRGCDTIRAVKYEHFAVSEFDAKTIIDEIASLPQKPLVVITGGEPLLHHKNGDLIAFLEAVLEMGCGVQFETNGTIEVDFERYKIYKKCHFAVSVKLKISGEPAQKRINPAALKSLFKNADCFYKFVVAGEGQTGGGEGENEGQAEAQIAEIKDILSLQSGEVWLMAKSSGAGELNKNAPIAAKIALKNGFNYTDRLHLRLNME